MPHTRRTFLLSAAALAACSEPEPLRVPTGEPSPGPDPTTLPPEVTPPVATTTPVETEVPGPEPSAPWDPPGEVDLATFACGIQTGDATSTAVLVSVRQYEQIALTVVLARGIDDGWEEVARLGDLLPLDGVLQVELADLIPDTTYSVVAYAADGVRRAVPARFRTALYPGASRIVRFGATSCLGSPGAPWASLSALAALKLDFFVLLGDTIYADEGLLPADDREGRWDEALATDGLRDLSGSTSLIATWDDHEVTNDWSWTDDGMPADGLDAYGAFRRALPLRDGPGGSGLWRKLAWGSVVDVFVLDCRGERVGEDYISPEQMAWLQDELLASTARFKIVANSVPITDMDAVYFGIAADDRWDGYPVQRAEILDWITDQAIPGVLWIAGDFHWGAVTSIGQPGEAYEDLAEVFCGPAGSIVNPLARLAPPDQYPVVVDRWNSVVFEADPDAGTIRVVFQGDGAILADHTITL